MILRNMITAWFPYSVYMVHTCITEIKEYDIRAHVYGMLVLRKMYDE